MIREKHLRKYKISLSNCDEHLITTTHSLIDVVDKFTKEDYTLLDNTMIFKHQIVKITEVREYEY